MKKISKQKARKICEAGGRVLAVSKDVETYENFDFFMDNIDMEFFTIFENTKARRNMFGSGFDDKVSQFIHWSCGDVKSFNFFELDESEWETWNQ